MEMELIREKMLTPSPTNENNTLASPNTRLHAPKLPRNKCQSPHQIHHNLRFHRPFRLSSSPLALIRHGRRVFNYRPNKDDTFLCNSMIRAHTDMRQFAESFTLYRNLRKDMGFKPDGYTFTALAKSCGLDVAIWEGQELHCHVIKVGLCLDLYVSTSLVDMYAKFGRMSCASKLFDEMTETSRVSWTALICGYARLGDMGNARRLFDEIPEKDLAAFNAMIDGYVKLGDMGPARSLFDE
ncbi:unnamed protein product [Prunus armeniaca]|uniref:Pentatricopeptide repeat-containing protein n=1 Tax=Prunus armeniaca TaxID=36596 RepID=A0A6J5WJX7_PRUAR|nr:unnamed protein product [Prunus armeniaca]